MIPIQPESGKPSRLNIEPPLMRLHRPVAPTIALIPAYNEARFIGSLVLAALAHVDLALVVDDGSSDQTAEIAQRAGATVIKHSHNQGKAAAVNTGFLYVRQLKTAGVVMLDGDGQHTADDIPRVLAPILAGEADIVVGSRFLEVKSNIPLHRQVGQHGLTLATNLASGVRISDSQSGYRAFSAHAIAELWFGQGGFSIESEMQFLIREHQLRVVEVPINVVYVEPAKRNPFNHGMQVINGILRLVGQTRPLLYFSTAGLAVFAIGLALGMYIIQIYARTHQLAIGYGLVTVMCSVVGMLLFFAGVILHSTRAMLIDLRQDIQGRVGAAVKQQDLGDRPQEELSIEVGR